MIVKKSALIIIDMQRGMSSATLPPRNNPEAEHNMAMLRDAWRQSGHPVINVRHMSRSQSSVFFPGQIGAEFQELFEPLPEEHVVEKTFRMRLLIPDWSAGFMCVISEMS